MCETCDNSRRRDPAARAQFEAAARQHANTFGVDPEPLMCAGLADDYLWSRIAGLSTT